MMNQVQEIGYKFREQIRRSQIEEIFKKKRREFGQKRNQIEGERMEKSEIINELMKQVSLNDGIVNIDVLKKLSLCCGKVENIELIGKSNFPQILVEFLKPKYLDTDEQYQTMWTLTALTYVGIDLMSKNRNLLTELMITAQSSQNKQIKINCLVTLTNIIHDGSFHLKESLLEPEIDIIGFFINLFMNEPTDSIILEILKCYYGLIRHLNQERIQPFKKLKKYLFFLIKSSANNQVVYFATLCLKCLFEGLNQDQKTLHNTGVLKSLTTHALGMGQDKMVMHTLKILALSAHKIDITQNEEIIFPFFSKLLPAYNTSVIHNNSYKILYDLIFRSSQSLLLLVNKFPSLFDIMLNQFEISSSTNVICELAHVFTIIIYNYSEEKDTQKGKRILTRLHSVYYDKEIPQQTRDFVSRIVNQIDP